MTGALSRLIERVQTGRSDVLPRRAARFEPDGAGAEPVEPGSAEPGPVALGAAELSAAELGPAVLEAREPTRHGDPPRTPVAETSDATAPSRRATAAAQPARPTPRLPPSPVNPRQNADPSPSPGAQSGADHPGVLHEIEVLVRQAAAAQSAPAARATIDGGPVPQAGYALRDEAEPQQAGAPQPRRPPLPVRSEPRGRASVREAVSPPPEPGLSIEIGRIEIIAPPRAPDRRIAPPMGPRLDLEGYLSARRKGER